MAYKLAIGNVFEFRVQAAIKDATTEHKIDARFTADRLTAQEGADLLNGVGEAAEATINEFLLQHISGWRGQKLVLEEDGQPAGFSHDALEAMLGVAGMGMLIYVAYLKAMAATDTSEGRRKN